MMPLVYPYHYWQLRSRSPVHDAPRVQVVQREQEGVQHHLHRLPLRETSPIAVQQPVEVAALGVLLDQDHVGALLQG